MADLLKIKVDFDGDTAKALLNFITETQEGKYTEQKPDVPPFTYRRLQVPEQDESNKFDDGNDESLLFGVSY